MSKLDRFLVSKGYLLALCLDRNLSDHRPILMRKLSIDYGPTPFRFFHSWFNLDGFEKMVDDTWKSLATVGSNGGINEEILSDRSLLLKELNDINSIDSLEAAHKSKVCWSIEGDENTKFFHADLERNVSNEEIKSEVWDCGTNKFPDLDGFTFEFFRRYWKLLEHDIVAAVKEFFATGSFLGITIDSSLTPFHLFFADDAIFVVKWDSLNICIIVNVLKCFHLALGLKINFHKSKLMGIGTPLEEVKAVVTTMGCLIFTSPFVYLGVKVGVPSGVLKLLESIRRNFFNGVDRLERKMAWIGWNKVLACKKYGGLEVSSFYALNRALLFKWGW
ncbi:hypothetical protein Tco_0961091 [Tanacetum coccineum]